MPTGMTPRDVAALDRRALCALYQGVYQGNAYTKSNKRPYRYLAKLSLESGEHTEDGCDGLTAV